MLMFLRDEITARTIDPLAGEILAFLDEAANNLALDRRSSLLLNIHHVNLARLWRGQYFEPRR